MTSGNLELEGQEKERNGAKEGFGESGTGPRGAPLVIVGSIAPLQRGGAELSVSVSVKDADGIARVQVAIMRALGDQAFEREEDPFTELLVLPLPAEDLAAAFVRVRVQDGSGRWTIADSNDFVVDATPPTVGFTTWPETWVTSNPQTVAFEASDAHGLGLGALRVFADEQPRFERLYTNTPTTMQESVTLEAPLSTLVYAGLVVEDAAGNETRVYTTNATLIAGSSPVVAPPLAPTVTWLTASPSADDDVRFAVGECGAGVEAAVSLSETAPTTGYTPCAMDGTFTLPPVDGSYVLRVFLRNAGGPSPASAPHTHVRDTTPPLIVFSNPAPGSRYAIEDALTATYAVLEENPSQEELLHISLALDAMTYSLVAVSPVESSYVLQLPDEASETAVLRFVLIDAAGNLGAAELPFAIDGMAPDAPIATWSSAGPSQSTSLAYVVSNCESGAFVAASTSPFVSEGLSFEPCAGMHSLSLSDDGSHTFYLFQQDSVGFISGASAPHTYVLDRMPPTLSVSSPASASIWGPSSPLSIVYSASDANFGATPISIALAPSGGTGALAAPVFTANDGLYLATTGDESTSVAAVSVRAEDLAGNATTVVVLYIVDADIPTAPSPQWSSGGPSTSPSLSFTISTGPSGECEPSSEREVAWALEPDTPTSGFFPCDAPVAVTVPAEGTHLLYVFLRNTQNGFVSSPSAAHTYIYDVTAPALGVSAPVDGLSLRANELASVIYTSSDPHFASQPLSFSLSLNGGGTVDLGVANNTGSFSFVAPSGPTGPATLTVRSTDAAGNFVEATRSVLLDGSAPQVIAFHVEGLGAPTGYDPTPERAQPVAPFHLRASDDVSALTHFCIKRTAGQTAPAPPQQDDECWISFSHPSVSASVEVSPPAIEIADYDVRYGFTRGFTYRLYAWVRDAAQRISTNSATVTVDQVPLKYEPGTAPIVTNVFASVSTEPDWPLPPSETSVGPSGALNIRWDVSFPNNTMDPSTGIVDLYYTEDDVSYQLIALDVGNGANGCAPSWAPPNMATPPNTTGCYRWASANMPSGAFSIRVAATDSRQITTSRNVVPPLNAIDTSGVGIAFLAGNTDPGIGGSALSTVFNTQSGEAICVPGLMAIDSRGVFYYSDRDNGLLRVSPRTGNTELLLPYSPSGSTGDGGHYSSATTRGIERVQVDLLDNVYVAELDRLRRINVNAQGEPTTIETVLGGGGLSAATGGTGPFSATAINWQCRACPIAPLANGDFYTMINTGSSPGGNLRILRYSRASATVEAIPVDSTAYAPLGGTTTIGSCPLSVKAVAFDPAGNGAVAFTTTTTAGTCPALGSVLVNVSATGAAVGPIAAPYSASACLIESASDGAVRMWNGSGSGSVFRYRPVTNDWEKELGSATYTGTNCADGSAALSCSSTVRGLTTDTEGRLYWAAAGQIRTLDEDGKVVTIYGENEYYGDSTLPLPNTPSLSARIGRSESIALWRDMSGEHITIIDSGNLRVREADVGGNIRSLAGNGTVASTPATNPSPAYAQPVPFVSITSFGVDVRNGDIYLGYDGSKRGILKLVRTPTLEWLRVIGCGAGTCGTSPIYNAPDGEIGANLSFPTSMAQQRIIGIFDRYLLYMAGHLVTHGPGVNSFQDYSIKAFDLDDNYRLFTTLAQSQLGPGYPADPPLTEANIMTAGTTRSLGWVGMFSTSSHDLRPESIYDPVAQRLIYPRSGRNATNRSIASLPFVIGPSGGTNLGDAPIADYHEISRRYSSFALRRHGANEYLYYCTHGPASGTALPDDYRLFVKNMTSNSSPVQLPWAIANLQCRGQSLIWDATRQSLVFPYQRNGLWGVAEYRNPPTPP
jgi:hypothetical protein